MKSEASLGFLSVPLLFILFFGSFLGETPGDDEVFTGCLRGCFRW